MSRGILNLILLVALAVSLGATWAIHPRPSIPNQEFMPEMVRTPRYNAYSANPNFAGGKTLQQPPTGTIPRGHVPFHFNTTPEDAVRAGNMLESPIKPVNDLPVMECCKDSVQQMNVQGMPMMQSVMPMMQGMPMTGMQNPPPGECCNGMQTGGQTGGKPGCCSAMMAAQAAKKAQARALERGAVVFAHFCQPCHGAGGNGDGLVVAKGYPAPPSLFAENAKKIKDGQIFHILTYGQKNMPAYATQVSREDRWNVIAYVRSLQAQPPAAPASLSAAVATAAPVQPQFSSPVTSSGGRP